MSKKNKGIWWLPYTWVAAFIGGTSYRLYCGGKLADALIDGACAFGAVYLLMTFITLVCFTFSKEGLELTRQDLERRRARRQERKLRRKEEIQLMREDVKKKFLSSIFIGMGFAIGKNLFGSGGDNTN